MLRSFIGIIRRLFDGYIIPRTCPVCGCSLESDEDVMCMECLIKMPLCYERGPEIFDIRGAIVNSAAPLGLAAAWYHYDPKSPYANLIRKAKYSDSPRMARRLGAMFAAEQLRRGTTDGELSIKDVDVLLPMPMHKSKLRKRGYNQSEEIALGMAEVLGIPVGDNLVAIKPHNTQTRLGNTERASNLHGCFALQHAEELAGLNVAIVDDIITTGASMTEAASTLSWGAPNTASISYLALARTVAKG